MQQGRPLFGVKGMVCAKKVPSHLPRKAASIPSKEGHVRWHGTVCPSATECLDVFVDRYYKSAELSEIDDVAAIRTKADVENHARRTLQKLLDDVSLSLSREAEPMVPLLPFPLFDAGKQVEVRPFVVRSPHRCSQGSLIGRPKGRKSTIGTGLPD